MNDKPIKVTEDEPIKAGKPIKTYVYMILDRSGSMISIRNETINHFNEQVQELRKKTEKGMDTRVSLTVFSGESEVVMFNKSVEKLDELTHETYSPNGSTALYDAIGLSMDEMERKLEDIKNDNVAVLVVILSDGEENSSRIYTQAQIANRIKALRETKRWTFVYIGANQDLEHVSKQLHIPQTNILRYAANSRGLSAASVMHTNSIGTYMDKRVGGSMAIDHGFYGKDGIADADSDENKDEGSSDSKT